ncbi:MAG: NAD(P)-binding domain-containing protein [Clostridia bacterium]|nr:NAD(P)-binding domain-containing protein [Clostridia bacterium]
MNSRKLKVAVLGTGNVGVAIAADLSLRGHDVTLIKTSSIQTDTYDLIQENNNSVFLKENGSYNSCIISEVTKDLSKISNSEVIFVAIQSTYHEELIRRISGYLKQEQIVVSICSYLSSFYFKKYCTFMPRIVEATGPYLEGRVELEDRKGEVVFRVGCRLSSSPLSVFDSGSPEDCLNLLKILNQRFSNDYTTIESALLNPNMVLHTVGSIMSIPRIEYSHGNFCMYREAYSRDNKSTIQIMVGLDEEKRNVLRRIGGRPVDIFEASGFYGNTMESFYRYSESSNRALSPTSVYSRYITEDVSQGLVLLESIANRIGAQVPLASALITIASQALDMDFRATGRTIERLGAEKYIDNCNQKS